MARIPVNMTTQELDVCPECKSLIYKAEGAWLDVWLPDHADTETPHRHQPVQDIV